MDTKKIILAGGTGSLGNFLTEYFSKKGFEIVVLSRSDKPSKGKIHFRKWDGKTLGEWVKEIDGAACVINLSGKSVNCRYTEENKKEIIIKQGYEYVSALNKKNALRKYRKGDNGSKKILDEPYEL